MIRVRTPSRLHFGLFCVPSAPTAPWLDLDGKPMLPRRHFGGVGLMIENPGIELAVEEAQTWSAEGPLADRALRFAQTYCSSAGIAQCYALSIASAAPEHAGLGTGTQLALGVARAIAQLTRQRDHDAVTLARHAGRGLRSALGVHGFEQGGFLVEGGKTTAAGIAPLLMRCDFPPEWHILLIFPHAPPGACGKREIEAFADLAKLQRDDRSTDALCRLVLLGMLPALAERDLGTFGEALYDFNRRVGEMFRPAQQGLYAHDHAEEAVKIVRAAGVKAVGQSSWGPTIFAIGTPEQVLELCRHLSRAQDLVANVIVTRACTHGATAANS